MFRSLDTPGLAKTAFGPQPASLRTAVIAELRSQIERSTLQTDALWEHIDSLIGGADPIIAAERLERFFDSLLQIPRINVRGRPGEEMHGYVPTPLKVIIDCLKRFPLKEDSIFCDIGSGLGRVPLLVHLLSGRPAFGIELDPSLAWTAQSIARTARLPYVQTIRGDAREMDFGFADTFFMFQPFEGRILRSVLGKLNGAAQEKPITVWWRGHHCDWFDEAPWLVWETERRDKAIGSIAVGRSVMRQKS